MTAKDLALDVLLRIRIRQYEDVLTIAKDLFNLTDKEYWECEGALTEADDYFGGIEREDQAKIIVEVLDEQEYFGDVGKPFHVEDFVPQR